jgi:hypothetical protein
MWPLIWSSAKKSHRAPSLFHSDLTTWRVGAWVVCLTESQVYAQQLSFLVFSHGDVGAELSEALQDREEEVEKQNRFPKCVSKHTHT